MEAINRAIREAGGRKRLADLIEVTPQFVWQMERGVRPVPPKLCQRIEQATGGAVTREQLRPDIFATA